MLVEVGGGGGDQESEEEKDSDGAARSADAGVSGIIVEIGFD